MENAIDIKNLNKSFGEVKAVDDLSFCVKKGELFAFLGVNGAGKSTTINILCGQLSKDSGSVLVDGEDIDKNFDDTRKKLGIVFQSSLLDPALTVFDNLYTRAMLYGLNKKQFLQRLEELAQELDFKNLLKRPINKLSGGQKRRIDIARALFHKPEILILDEPTTGLDPQTRKLIWQIIFKQIKESHMTVLLTTHYMEEASEADYIVILDSGKIVTEGTPLELKNQHTLDYITVYNQEEETVKKLGYNYSKIKDAYKIEIPNTKIATELIVKYPQIFCDYEITKGKMDDVFLSVTGKSLTEEDKK